VSRVELQRGANNVLFGIGSPAGIINTNLKPAEFFTQGQLEYRYAEYNSHRLSADYNVEVLDNELAVRAIGLWERKTTSRSRLTRRTSACTWRCGTSRSSSR
jgi:outer membrane receptor protein involved in Fe transport